MSRQHATPVLIMSCGKDMIPLTPLALTAGADQVSEATIQALVHAHPACLPIAEIDPLFNHPVPICTELNTRAGPIDNLLITASGLPVLVECKLWRNPEGRREVVITTLKHELGSSARIAFGPDFPDISDNLPLPDFDDAKSASRGVRLAA
ncbi:hypothetical protein [Sphingomonas sp.]|jgi:hypothetical protein|uniref:hypothetical protein n=1 Tax=Sphingomonas sp. TaxID=28214 RepID=UPI002ED9EDF6